MLSQTSSVIEGYRGDKENLIRTFYLVIQVSHLLMAGQVRIRAVVSEYHSVRIKNILAELVYRIRDNFCWIKTSPSPATFVIQKKNFCQCGKGHHILCAIFNIGQKLA